MFEVNVDPRSRGPALLAMLVVLVGVQRVLRRHALAIEDGITVPINNIPKIVEWIKHLLVVFLHRRLTRGLARLSNTTGDNRVSSLDALLNGRLLGILLRANLILGVVRFVVGCFDRSCLGFRGSMDWTSLTGSRNASCRGRCNSLSAYFLADFGDT